MNKFKTICLSLLIGLTIFSNIFINAESKVNISDQKYIRNDQAPVTVGGENINWEDKPIQAWTKFLWDKLNGILNNLAFPDNYDTSLWRAMALIQTTINRLLGMLAFIALIYMIYCWARVFAAWADDTNAKKWKKWITTSAIALAWIWLSWLIISAMIWFIKLMAW